ncbi:DNA repair protein RecO [Wenxinia saemankumensis]|uniref:DNA repair protein RecO n=1 Tax=Wenxinia saemankumensis TaxID=1447782 RepID=A0A1M6EHG6_9RHOB|nr:DNA repair protein RecO [Wenxinia saemankumensis]SHI84881.1 DNA replication and repair protein RecO [Wenxinia saemankumensis]
MIEWQDSGTILAVRPHGENGAIVEVFTAAHGRHAGHVRGGTGRRLRGTLQPGAQVAVRWTARLDAHLGHFTVEPRRSRAAQVLTDRLALAGLTTVAALLGLVLPERDPHPRLFARTEALFDLLGDSDLWPLAYLQWELALLDEMGFGLDLARCAVTGGEEGLAYVSPRSGRAVSAAAAGDWAPRLLPLPPVLRGAGEATGPEIAAALGTTGWFLQHRLLGAERPLPAARERLVAAIDRQG